MFNNTIIKGLSESQKIEQLLRKSFAAGMLSTIQIDKFHSDKNMYEQSHITDRYFNEFMDKNIDIISKLLLK